jgi:hypothetical protein
MKCNVGLECKLECQSWNQEKNNFTPINEKQKIKSWNRINKTKQNQKHQQKNLQKKKKTTKLLNEKIYLNFLRWHFTLQVLELA